jgi:hypothetical protein
MARAFGPTMNHIPRPIAAWAPSTPAVSATTIPVVLRENAVVVVHFWAVWNGYDPVMDRNVQTLRGEFEDQIHFCSCDVDLPENGELCRICGVLNLPTLACFVRGRFYQRLCGVAELGSLRSALEDCLAELTDQAGPIDPADDSGG